MSDSPESLSGEDSTAGQWLQLLLFGVGGILFLVGMVTALPGTPLGLPGADDTETATASATGTPATSPTATAATPTSTSTSTATPAPATTVGTPTVAPPSGTVVYRVNVGGPRLRSSGSGPAWSADRANAPSPYLNARASDTVVSDTPDNVTLDDGVPPGVPERMFTDYRFERGADQPRYEEMTWRFPVDPGREYEVRIYVVEAFFTRGPPPREGEERYSQGGPRTFGVAVENRTVLRNYEPIAAHGHDVGGVRTFRATTEDDTLVVRFLREQENPTVSGIEIVDVGPRTERRSPSPTARRSSTSTQSGPDQNTRDGGGQAGPDRGSPTPGRSPTETSGGGGGWQTDRGTASATPSPSPTPTPTDTPDDWWTWDE